MDKRLDLRGRITARDTARLVAEAAKQLDNIAALERDMDANFTHEYIPCTRCSDGNTDWMD